MAYLAGGAVASKLAGVLASIVLARLLAPEHYGAYALATGFVLLGRVAQDAGVRDLAIQEKSAWRPAVSTSLHGMAFVSNAGITVACSGVALLALQGTAALAPTIVLAFSILIASPWAMRSAELLQLRGHGKIARAEFGATLCQHVVAIVLAMAGFGAPALALGFFARQLALMVAAKTTLSSAFRGVPTALRTLLTRRKAVASLLIANAGMAALAQGDYLVLGAIVDVKTLGFYFFGFQLVLQLASVVGTSLHGALFPHWASTSREVRQGDYYQVLGWTLHISIAVATAGVMVAPVLVPIVFGPQWTGAIPVVQWMLIGLPLRTTLAIPKALILADGRFLSWGLRSCLVASVAICGSTVGALVADSATGIAMGAALATSLACAILLVSEAPISVVQLIKATWPSLCSLVLSLGGGFAIHRILTTDAGAGIVSLILTVAIFVGMATRMRHASIK